MRCNANTIIIDRDVVLVPYRKEHVAKYHEWMTSPELQELTASEPLTLEQEYEMQRKWRNDEDKLTFIILAGPSSQDHEETETLIDGPQDWETLRRLPMIGDVNLFLKGDLIDEDFEAEVEIMIAEGEYRRRGLALTALQLMLSYATSPLSPGPLPVPRERLVARIGERNTPSIRLFEKLGFVVTKRVAVFEEVEMRYKGGEAGPWKEGRRRILELRGEEDS